MASRTYSGAATLASLAQAFPGVPDRLPPLMALTDPARTPDVPAFAAGLPDGCGLIYRHFGRPERFDDAARLADLVKEKALKLLISADPELAAECGADGLHWPMRLSHHAKQWRQENADALMTMSAHNRNELVIAREAGADGVLLSPIFPTRSPNSGPAIGTLQARTLVAHAGLPVYALGGVTAENAPHLKGIGFSGIAAIDGLSD